MNTCIAAGAIPLTAEASFEAMAPSIGPTTCAPSTATNATAANVAAIPWIMAAIFAMSFAVSSSTNFTSNFV
ncbi:hypothetical protein D9M73_207340 [compost metagenome]